MKTTYKIIDNEQLMSEWDWEKNNELGLNPKIITSGTHKKAWWICSKCGRNWYASIKNRIYGTGCTCDAESRRIKNLHKYNTNKNGSLADTRPDIAKEWHPTKNTDPNKTPDTLTANSEYKAWWINQDGEEWQQRVNVRCRRIKISQINRSMLPLRTKKKFDNKLFEQWVYEKNNGFKLDEFNPSSSVIAWWQCEKGHQWEASIRDRVYGRECPICSNERSTSFPEQTIFYYIKQIFADAINRYITEDGFEFDIYIPSIDTAIEYDGSYYHKFARKLDRDEKKNLYAKDNGITLYRFIEKNSLIPKYSENVIFYEIKNKKPRISNQISKLIFQLSSASVDIDVARDNEKILEQYILSEKANSISEKAPNLIKEWHPTKNATIKPEYVQIGSNKKFWWKCSTCGHEWKTTAYSRYRGSKCPVCTGNIVKKGINDICTTHPEIIKFWDFSKNSFTPDSVSKGSNKRVYLKCPICNYEWNNSISNVTRSNGCPRCNGYVPSYENSIAKKYPSLVKQWDNNKNINISPNEVFPNSNKYYWWICDKGHSWKATPSSRTQGNNCPYCGNKKLLVGYNDLATVRPDLLSQWDYEKNTVSPNEVIGFTNKKYWWKCKKKPFLFIWYQ